MRISNINKEAISKLTRKVAFTSILGISTMTMSGCNRAVIDINKTYDKAIIIGDGIVTIYDIASYTPYETERYQLKLPDGTYLMTSTVTTRFISTKDSGIDAEEFAKTLVPDNYEVRYVDKEKLQGMQKVKQ